MERHPHFNLLIHENHELGEWLGVPITNRTTLHEWPLSCVQRIVDADGRPFIYKSQSEPSIEDLFYQTARSPLLPKLIASDRIGRYRFLLLEYLDGSRLDEANCRKEVATSFSRDLVGQIAAIEGDVPGYQILDTGHWPTFQDEIVQGLRGLMKSGSFVQVDSAKMVKIEAAVESNIVIDRIRGEAGLIHGDLTPDNVMLSGGSYRVLDWQYVRRGPGQVDLATLLEGFGIDPRPHVEPGIVSLVYLMRIHWLMACATRWFPAGALTYDQEIAQLAARLP